VLLPATQQDVQAIRAGDMITFFSWIEPKKKGSDISYMWLPFSIFKRNLFSFLIEIDGFFIILVTFKNVRQIDTEIAQAHQ
jgi:hypothetical protein